jgi:DNA-binding transcriptional LysR family regulator
MTSMSQKPADQLAIQQLRAFCCVCEKHSYAAASRELGLPVPTLWEQVRTLEKRTGALLFMRRGRNIEPTPAAEMLWQSLQSILTGLDSTFELLREEAGDLARTITVVTGARMMLEDLGPPLKEFRERYPRVRLRLIHDQAQGVEQRIVSGEGDLALALERGPGLTSRAVCSERAYRIDYLAVLPRRHALARKSSLDLADLACFPLIVGHSETYGRQLLDQALHHEGLLEQMQVAAETDTSAFTIACVRAGMGIGIVAGRPRGTLSRGLVVRPLTRQLGQAWIAFVWKRGRRLPAALTAMMELIRAAAGKAFVTNSHRRGRRD